jgi:hypothetical protein
MSELIKYHLKLKTDRAELVDFYNYLADNWTMKAKEVKSNGTFPVASFHKATVELQQKIVKKLTNTTEVKSVKLDYYEIALINYVDSKCTAELRVKYPLYSQLITRLFSQYSIHQV